jgi:ankyrin repeat protein
MLNDEPLTRWFLDNGADPSLCDLNCLEIAAAYSTPRVFDLLMRHGCKLEGCHPLHKALDPTPEWRTSKERADMLEHLIKLGCDINEVIDLNNIAGGGAPLHVAVDSGMIDEVRWLVENGADVLLRNLCGHRPASPSHVPNEETVELMHLVTFYETRYREMKNSNSAM